MRKHLLLKAKRTLAGKLPWYVKFTDEQLRQLSRRQIEMLAEALNNAEQYRESCAVWYTLDVNRAIRKATKNGEPEIIVEICDDTTVRRVDRDYILSTAARSILRKYDLISAEKSR